MVPRQTPKLVNFSQSSAELFNESKKGLGYPETVNLTFLINIMKTNSKSLRYSNHSLNIPYIPLSLFWRGRYAHIVSLRAVRELWKNQFHYTYKSRGSGYASLTHQGLRVSD